MCLDFLDGAAENIRALALADVCARFQPALAASKL